WLRMIWSSRGQGRLPLDGTVRVVSEVAEALAEAHEQGVGHFAVRPEHIWFEQAPAGTYARLGGFGHTLLRHEVTLLDAHQASRPILVDHWAPETLDAPEGRAWLDSMGLISAQSFDAQWGDAAIPRAELDPSPVFTDHASVDVFGLAVLAYRCLTGAHPYVAKETATAWRDALEGLSQGQLIPPRDHGLELPAAVWRVLQSGLARDPGARPPSVVAFARALNAALPKAVGKPSARLSAIRPAVASSVQLDALHEPEPSGDEGISTEGPVLWGPEGPPLEGEPDDANGDTPPPVPSTHSAADPEGDEPSWDPEPLDAHGPRVRYLATALAVLVLTNLLTLALLTGGVEVPSHLRLEAAPDGVRWSTLTQEGAESDLEEPPELLPPDQAARYRIVLPGQRPIELRWNPLREPKTLLMTLPQPATPADAPQP
ncbi:MAG: hypothetical protein AAFX99_33365, partial [Myxococcota bacterium]